MDDASTTTLKKQAIIDEAYRLFYARGFHATGVDALLADSGISKRTLYKYFPSKEALIEAVLEHYLAVSGDGLLSCAESGGGDARTRIRRLFEIKRDAVASGDFQGCLAIKAQQEFAGCSPGIENLTQRASQLLEAGFTRLTREAGVVDPESKARTLLLLLQGAVVASQMRRNPEPFNDALKGVDLVLGQKI